ncbi:MAG: sortase [Chloroflexota bacterium]|nr:sortase [Chloroflexota bacterium]
MRRFLLLAAGLTAALLPTATTWASPAAPPAAPAGDPAFARVWARTDQLVRGGTAQRSWLWGAAPFARVSEPFAGAPGGSRVVEYYDKARMEVANPAADRNSPWFVTNGLLVKELISGLVAVGPTETELHPPSTQPVVGDAVATNPAPSYAALGLVASLVGPTNRAANRVGSHVAETLDASGLVGTAAALAAQPGTRLGTYIAASGHNVPDIFWTYELAQGVTLNGRTLQNAPLMNPLYTLGYPISEPYWVRAQVGGQVRDVLIQAFERRVLAYTPSNTPAWQVEMGNVGRHYYDWRYGAQKPGLLAAPVVATRIVSPALRVDTRITPTYVEGGAWQVADYAAGWLYGTVQPGQVGNSVFAGHNNWHGEVFRYLEFGKVGDLFTIYTSDNVAHRYRVSEMYKVPEQGLSRTEQLAYAKYTDPTPDERVTLITCWPYHTYTHRLILIGKPVAP